MGNNNNTAIKDFSDKLSKVDPEFEPVAMASKVLDNVAFYDFASYEYLLPVEINRGFQLSNSALRYLDELRGDGAPPKQVIKFGNFLRKFEYVLHAVAFNEFYWSSLRFENLDDLIFNELYSYYRNRLVVHSIYDDYRGYLEKGWSRKKIDSVFYYRLTSLYLDALAGREYRLLENVENAVRKIENGIPIYHWEYYSSFLPDEYPFEIFSNDSVNVGLRLIYRQEWMPLGAQPGEIVRTIPLGPGQTRRITTKIVRRRKSTSTMERSTETETTTETTDTTKDSSEIVGEWASDWKKEKTEEGKVEASFDVLGFFGGGGEYSQGTVTTNNISDKSKDTSSNLSESMRKTASKMRAQTKIVVSTESETTFEQENFSEISNPNNEMAITYKYHKLQQQYQVTTYLAEVQSVIFVAEDIPSPGEVNVYWVRKYDWIISKMLKDESHRATLNELIQDVDEVDPIEEGNDDPFADMLDKVKEKFAFFQPNTGAPGGGLSVPDIYAEPQHIYQQHLRDRAARKRANKIREIKRQRLFQHIRDNILYYCRAIWAHEDSDQRILRYKKENRSVPIEWTFGPVLGKEGFSWKPTGKEAPLWELIDPTGPLGFAGNYAVFALRPLPEKDSTNTSTTGGNATFTSGGRRISEVEPNIDTVDLNAVLTTMRAPYVGDDGRLLDPALTAYRQEAQEIGRRTPEVLTPQGEAAEDILSYLPRLGKRLLDDDGEFVGYSSVELENDLTPEQYGEYLYKKNGIRRFLVDSNNLYLSIHTGEGVALEPFKRAHRWLDVQKTNEELNEMQLKNARRNQHLDDENAFDPDIDKVVIIGDGNSQISNNLAAEESRMDLSENISNENDE